MTTISTPTGTSTVDDIVDAARAVTRPARALTGVLTWSRVERGGTFLLPLAVYLWIGARVALTAQALPGDALSRTAAASATVLGRDPHLEAIGFVWGPFPTLWQVPLVWLGRGWRPMVVDGFAAVIVSASFMAGTVAVVRRWLQECGIGAVTRVALVVVFALNPFIVLYGANGMSEAGLLFFGAVAAHRLARWWERDRPADLVVCGIALAFAYLTRYEATASIATVIVAVTIHSFRTNRTQQDTVRNRWRTSLLAAASVGAPPVFAFVSWAFASWAIVGEPFAQLTSQYGNSAMVRASAGGIADTVGGDSVAGRMWFFARQLGVFGGLAVVAVALLAWFGTRAGARVAAALLVLGPCLAFNLFGAATGATYVWARYVIVAVPMAVLLLGPFVRSVTSDSPLRWATRVAPAAAVALSIIAGTVAHRALSGGDLQSDAERDQLSAVPVIGRGAPVTSAQLEGQRIAADIDRLGIGEGQVLTDAAITFAVVMSSADQSDFVVPSDREFDRILADPVPGGIKYLLVSDAAGAQFDAVAHAFPELASEDGGTVATRIAEWGGEGSVLRLRLYELSPTAGRR